MIRVLLFLSFSFFLFSSASNQFVEKKSRTDTHTHTHTRIRAHEPVIKCERRRWKKNIHHYTTTRVHISKSAPTKTNWNNTKIKRWYAVRSHAQQCTRPSLVRAIWTEHLFAHLHSRVAGAAALSSLFLRNAEDKTSKRNEFIQEFCVCECVEVVVAGGLFPTNFQHRNQIIPGKNCNNSATDFDYMI